MGTLLGAEVQFSATEGIKIYCEVHRKIIIDIDMSYTRVLHIKVAYRVPQK
jgi:hypothetical protein